MNCVFLDQDTLGNDVDLSQLFRIMDLTTYGQTPRDEDIILARIQEADCVISNKVPLTSKVLEQAKKLKAVFAAATGVDHIDLKTCHALHIPVCNTRNYAGASLVQHVLATILYFANQHHRYHHTVIDGCWSAQSLFCVIPHKILELQGKTLGIVGFGNLGQQVAEVASALRMNVLISKSFTSTTSNSVSSKQRVPFETLLAASDFISLHCPLTPQTDQLFNETVFQHMKPSAYLINTARGRIVDTAALLNALDNNTIAGAALDVFEQEPLPADHPLLTPRQNLLLTPHIAWASTESRQRLITELELNMQAWLQGRIRNQVSNL